MVLGLISGDYVHLAVLYPHYRTVIAEKGGGLTAPVTFPWGDDAVSVMDGMRLINLVYDASPTTAKYVGQIRDDPDIEGFKNYTRHMVGNFYLEEVYTP